MRKYDKLSKINIILIKFINTIDKYSFIGYNKNRGSLPTGYSHN